MPSTRDFSSADTRCWIEGCESSVCTVNMATSFVVANLRPGPLTSATELFLQSSARLVAGGTATNASATSLGLNFISWYFLVTCWTLLAICCSMEINSSSLALSAVLCTNSVRLLIVACASWRSSRCLSNVSTFLSTTSCVCCNKTS